MDDTLSTVASKLEHSAQAFPELQGERMVSLHCCALYTCAQLENSLYWWWEETEFSLETALNGIIILFLTKTLVECHHNIVILLSVTGVFCKVIRKTIGYYTFLFHCVIDRERFPAQSHCIAIMESCSLQPKYTMGTCSKQCESSLRPDI